MGHRHNTQPLHACKCLPCLPPDRCSTSSPGTCPHPHRKEHTHRSGFFMVTSMKLGRNTPIMELPTRHSTSCKQARQNSGGRTRCHWGAWKKASDGTPVASVSR